MSKFDCMNFSDGCRDIEFVSHAKKFSKRETIDLFMIENKNLFSEGYRKPTLEDVRERAVRYYPVAPEGYGFDGGCYSYCKPGEKGSFPVWVIEFEPLRKVKNNI